jgi:hypothetical protein
MASSRWCVAAGNSHSCPRPTQQLLPAVVSWLLLSARPYVGSCLGVAQHAQPVHASLPALLHKATGGIAVPFDGPPWDKSSRQGVCLQVLQAPTSGFLGTWLSIPHERGICKTGAFPTATRSDIVYIGRAGAALVQCVGSDTSERTVLTLAWEPCMQRQPP